MPSELIELLSKRVIGQTDAKRVLAVAVYQHFLACAESDLHGGRVESAEIGNGVRVQILTEIFHTLSRQ